VLLQQQLTRAMSAAARAPSCGAARPCMSHYEVCCVPGQDKCTLECHSTCRTQRLTV
jgi:hypothetical protein